MKLIIHAGLHRAASTAFQKWLNQSQQTFGNARVYVAGPVSGENPASEAFGFLIGKRLAALGPAAAAGRLRAVLDSLSGRYETVLLSDENLLGPMPDARRGALAAAPLLMAVLDRVRDDHEVVPLVILREHVAWLQSIHAVQVLRGESLDFAEFASTTALLGTRFRPLLEGLAAVSSGEGVVVETLDRIAADAGASFLGRVGQVAKVAFDAGERLPAANAAPPWLLCRIAQEVTRLGGCFTQAGRSTVRTLCAELTKDGSASAARAELISVVARKSAMVPPEIRGALRLRTAAGLLKLKGGDRAERIGRVRAEQAVAAAMATSTGPLLSAVTANMLWEAFAADRAWLRRNHAIHWDLPPASIAAEPHLRA